MNFEGKVAVITGSSAGIGAEAAKKISALGGKVTINYSKSKEAAEEVAHECSRLGGSPLIIKSDIATDEGCKHLIDRAFRGHVIDFLHFHYENYSFYVFNFADTYITVGVVIYSIGIIYQYNKRNEDQTS